MKRLFIVAAVFAAVATHRCVDFLVSLGLVPDTAAGYGHIAVMPVALVAAAALVGVLSFAYADRDGSFDRTVRKLEAAPLTRIFATVFLLACVALFTMESIEQIAALGRLDAPAAWLGTSVPVALTLFGAIAYLVARCLKYGARTLLNALRAARAIVEVAIAIRTRAGGVQTFASVPSIDCASYVVFLTNVRGLRAPPQIA